MELPAGRMSGITLRTVVAAMRHTPARHVVARVLRGQLGIDALSAFPVEMCAALPQSFAPLAARTDHHRASAGLALPSDPETLSGHALAEAYRSGALTPLQVTEHVLGAAEQLKERTPNMNPFYALRREQALEDARASTQRHRAGQSRGPLDGLIVPIKEEVDVAGLPTRLGTGWMADTPAERDSVVTARLRAAGAIVVGNTVMTEYGMSPLGANPHRTMPRNVHAPDRLAGGSSTGSTVAVGLGLASVALGTDGGGSIRIPAAYNGLFGLKATYGRVPLTGHGAVAGSSVVHAGPIGTTAADLAHFLEIAAGSDAGDWASTVQPPIARGELHAALARGVKGLVIGVDEEQWAYAPAGIAAPGRAALAALERDGARLVPVRSRLAHHASAIGYLTIGIEAFAALRLVRTHIGDVGPDLQLTLTGLETFRPDDYVVGQRLRGELRRETARLLSEVDVLALPSTANVAPPITDAEARSGIVDPPALDAASRYVYVGNLTGIPCGTAPVGTWEGLPVGLQILGDAWDEACVLQVLAHLERIGIARAKRPNGYVDVLAR
jgi:aspartyl-tRNA(Asn)/glutamyl-tRNA(Gln) amidotransferase subunit A